MSTRTVKIVPTRVVISCELCGQFYEPVVQFEDGMDPIVGGLPEHCDCGHPLDTYETVRDIIGTAWNIRDAIDAGRLPC